MREQDTKVHGNTKTAVLYLRVSTSGQDKRDLSIPAQREDLGVWATERGYAVADEFVDPAVSGDDWWRPSLNALRERVAQGDVDIVLMRDRSRLGRDGGVLADTLQYEFALHNTRILTMDGFGEDDTPEAELNNGIMDRIAKYQRQKTTESSMRGKLQKARRGEVPPGRFAPYGYHYDRDAKTYAVDPKTAPHLRRLFRMVGHEGESLTAVKRAFEEGGVPTPGGGQFWHVSTVRRIIDDEIYVPRTGRELGGIPGVPTAVAATLIADTEYGIYWWGRSRVKRPRKVRGNEPAVVRTPSDPSEHVAIPVEGAGVPAEWLLRARERVSENVKQSFAGGRPRELSGGLLRCPCGSAMTVFTNRRGGRRNFFYVCGSYRRHGKASGCESWKYHKVEPLEVRARDFAYRVASNPDALREKLQGQLDQEHAEVERQREEERALLEVLRDADVQRERIVRLYARGGLTDAEYDVHAGEIDGRKASTARRLEELREPETPLSTTERVALFESYLRDLPGIVEGFVHDVREYETSEATAERTPENPHGIYRLTEDSIRFLSEEEMAERRAELEDRRASRYRWLYETLGLSVTAERDGTLDIQWGAGELRRIASTVT